MGESITETKIVFGDEKKLEERREKLKSLRGYKTDLEYLLDESHETSKALTDLMVAEGLSEDFIRFVMRPDTDEAYLMTLDFLHCAALIAGEDYVRKNLIGRTIPLSDAAKGIKESYHEQQLKPYREIYENLDERLKAAKEGELLLNHQIEILKIQSVHAEQMYEKALETERMKSGYEERLKEEKNTLASQKDKEKISTLEAQILTLKEYAKSLEKENRDLKAAYEQCLTQDKEDMGDGKFVDFSWRRKRKRKQLSEEEKQERTGFSLSVLGNREFSPEQISILLPVLENGKIPLNALQKLCQPSLPAENMKAFVRFLEGGNANEAKP